MAQNAEANAEQKATEKQENATPGDDSSLELKVKRDDGKRATTLNDDVAMPGYVAPGDTPHDTTVTAEHASSVDSLDKGAAARKGFGVVNAVVPIADPSGRTQARAAEAEVRGKSTRTETYEARDGAGRLVKVEHNLDTGETKVVG